MKYTTFVKNMTKGGDKKMEKILIGVTALAALATAISTGVCPLQFL